VIVDDCGKWTGSFRLLQCSVQGEVPAGKRTAPRHADGKHGVYVPTVPLGEQMMAGFNDWQLLVEIGVAMSPEAHRGGDAPH
jgi:hypothetical protein